MNRLPSLLVTATASVWLLLASLFAASATEAVPDKLIVLTFDDSVASHYTVARPMLKRYGFGASFFITEGFNFRTNKKDYMTWEQIAELQAAASQNAKHIRELAEQLQVTVAALEKAAAIAEARYRRPTLLSVIAIVLSSIALGITLIPA